MDGAWESELLLDETEAVAYTRPLVLIPAQLEQSFYPIYPP